jgi:hypothetical protein
MGMTEVLRALRDHHRRGQRQSQRAEKPAKTLKLRHRDMIDDEGEAMTSLKSLGSYRRIVIKIGSALLVDRKAGLKKSWLDAMCADIASLKAKGVDVLVVSSGAIALGRSVLDLPAGALKLEESQAAAAVGQIALARAGRKACRSTRSLPARSC